MLESTLSTKGQFVLPKEIRDRLGWHAGTRLEVVEAGEAVVLRRPTPFARTDLDAGLGLLPSPHARPVSLDDMNAGIDADLRARWRP